MQVTMKKGDVKEEKLSCTYPCKLKTDVPSFRKKKFVAVTKVDPKLRLSFVLSVLCKAKTWTRGCCYCVMDFIPEVFSIFLHFIIFLHSDVSMTVQKFVKPNLFWFFYQGRIFCTTN